MKKDTIISIVISVIISFVILIIALLLSNKNTVKLSDFSIGSFNLETETTDYSYIDNYTTYSGEASISCKDKRNNYVVLVKIVDDANDVTNYSIALINNGKGEISTYDSNSDGKKKPDYNFEIVGFLKFDK